MEERRQTAKDYIVTFKLGTIAVLVTLMFSTLVGIGVAYEKVQARLRHLDAKTELYQTQFDALEDRVDNNDVQFAEIKKDLCNIEAILLEIKTRINLY